MRYLPILLLSCLLILCQSGDLSAQNRTDFGVWAGLELDQKIIKNLSASFNGQVRLNGNANYFKSTFASIGVGYKIHKMFSVTVGYRYTLRPERNNHRVYLDANGSYKIAKTGLQVKLRLRTQYDDSDDNTRFPSLTLRPRLYLGFSPKGKFAKRFTFYVTGEIFYQFVQSYDSFNKWRFSGGINYDIGKDITLNLRYIMQDEVNVKVPVMDHILMVGLSVDLPDFKKKKKGKKKKEKKKD